MKLSLYLVSAFVLVACAEEAGDLKSRRARDGQDGDGTTEQSATDSQGQAVQCADTGRKYAGFDATSLTAARPPTRLGDDRARMKPFSALQTEYTRVLGNTPASLAGSGPTFGQVPKMWFEEPQANAVALQTAFNIAFDGCLTYTQTAPEFAGAPDAKSAETQCSAMARKFWSKTPGPQEIQACVDMAVTGTASEPDARRRWSYACASVLTSAGFLSY